MTAKRKPAAPPPDPYDYRAHQLAGVTTVKVSRLTRELLHQVAQKYRTQRHRWSAVPDVNETIFLLATAELKKKA